MLVFEKDYEVVQIRSAYQILLQIIQRSNVEKLTLHIFYFLFGTKCITPVEFDEDYGDKTIRELYEQLDDNESVDLLKQQDVSPVETQVMDDMSLELSKLNFRAKN